jgi:hypothetical protein
MGTNDNDQVIEEPDELKGSRPVLKRERSRRLGDTRRAAKSCADGLVVYDEAERGILIRALGRLLSGVKIECLRICL